MTSRKPAGVSFESWIERQLREARERGSFDDLPGAGKPLPRTASDELAWLREKARREDLPVTALLPPSLAVAKEVEDLPARLSRERSEPRARKLVEDLNARIDAARRGPQVGPPVRTALLDVEGVVGAWREASAGARPAEPPPVAEPPAPGPRRRWLRRR
jgi:hypothetical protein